MESHDPYPADQTQYPSKLPIVAKPYLLPACSNHTTSLAPYHAVGIGAKRTTGGWRAATLILSMEVCERMATLGIGLNLVTYLHHDMHLPIPKAANIVTNFMGTSFLTCLLGGLVADTYLGRYSTIAASSSIHVLGITLLTVSSSLKSLKPHPCIDSPGNPSCPPASAPHLAILYLALYLTAFGTGGIKSSVSGLGADQFDEREPKERLQMQSYFNWFTFGITMGAMLAVTVLVYVQDNEGRGVGYGVCVASMVVALCIFVGGTRSYRLNPPEGSPLTKIAQVLVAAWENRNLQLPTDPSELFQGADELLHAQVEAGFYNVGTSTPVPKLRHTNQFLFLDKGAVIPKGTQNLSTLLQDPWRLSSLRKVEEVKMVIRLLPIVASTIVFWTANAQMLTFSIEQGATLDRRIGGKFEIPPASLAFFLQISILITIIFSDRVVVPLARKWTGYEQGIKTLQRVGLGLFFSLTAMVIAALVERKRLEVAHTHGNVGSRNLVLPMSVFFLVPQYALVGVGEAFAYIGLLDFFYRESPHGMRSMGTGLCLSNISLGYFFSSALVSSINNFTKHGTSPGWLTNNLNNGRLDNFYWFLAFTNSISLLAYIFCAHWYQSNHGIYGNGNQDEDFTRETKIFQLAIKQCRV